MQELKEIHEQVMFAAKTEHKPCQKCNLEHPLGPCARADNQKVRNDILAPLLHRMTDSRDKEESLKFGREMVTADIKGAQNAYKPKGGKHGKDQPGKAAGGANIGERERASPELLKKCREEKLCIQFAMTGKCDKEPDCKFGHRRVHDKRVGFKGAGVSMMNFLTNVTHDARQESGA